MIWGQCKNEEDIVPRAQYYGKPRRSPLDDEMNEVYYEDYKRSCAQFCGYSISIFIVLMVLSLVAAITILKQNSVDWLMIGTYDASMDACAALNAL